MPGMNERFVSSGLSLACHIARPSGEVEAGPAVVLCHGFPIASLDAQRSAGTFPELIDRISRELGCVAMTFNFRGCGDSEGDFSLQGWVDDLRNAISHLLASDVTDRGDPARHQHRWLDRDLCRCRRPSGVGGWPSESSCRLRRLGGTSAPLPRTRP